MNTKLTCQTCTKTFYGQQDKEDTCPDCMESLMTNERSVSLKHQMDSAISHYIAYCTNTNPSDIDYSSINTEIDDAITLLNGTAADEDM